MSNTCWTCGSPCVGFTYKCSQCEQLLVTRQLDEHVTLVGGQVDSQLKVLAREATSANEELGDISGHLGHLRQFAMAGTLIEVAQLNVLRELSQTLPKAIAHVEQAVRWSCQQLIWHLKQQTDVIRSIDETLKTPVQTRANEWRVMADKLRERGALKEAVEFYEKSLAESPLDYRTYVGHAEVLIQLDQGDKALAILTQSLPHAPRNAEGEITDWRSHSLRTIAHIHHCQGSHDRELLCLRQAVTLSPQYQSARYEMAVAAAECQQLQVACETLDELVHQSDLYFEMARRQATFLLHRDEIIPILRRAREARIEAKLLIPQSRLREELSEAQRTLAKTTLVISKRIARKVMAEISSCSTIIASYKATLGHLETAGSPRELADIELQANQLKQHQAEFRTQFNKATEDLKTVLKTVTSEMSDLCYFVLGMIVFAVFIGAVVASVLVAEL